MKLISMALAEIAR